MVKPLPSSLRDSPAFSFLSVYIDFSESPCCLNGGDRARDSEIAHGFFQPSGGKQIDSTYDYLAFAIGRIAEDIFPITGLVADEMNIFRRPVDVEKPRVAVLINKVQNALDDLGMFFAFGRTRLGSAPKIEDLDCCG